MSYCILKIDKIKSIDNISQIDISQNIDNKKSLKFLLISNNNKLVGIYIFGQKHFPQIEENWIENRDLEIFKTAELKLKSFLRGETKKIDIEYELIGTNFQRKIWEEVLKIPYGKTVSYEFIANRVCCKSSRAIANAISKNPLIFLVPCHRIIGKNGKLTGYAAGLDLKEKLLKIENTF